MQKKRRTSPWFKAGMIILLLILVVAAVVFAKEIKQEKQEEKEEKEEKMSLLQTAANASGETINLYYGDRNAEFIIKREVKVPQITPENLTAALTEQGILEPGTEVLSLKKRTEDGKELMDLDFNEKFRETLFSVWNIRGTNLYGQCDQYLFNGISSGCRKDYSGRKSSGERTCRI